jgi:hypothetical protein
METPDSLMAPVKTRGDFRRMSESARHDVRRDSDTPDLPDGHALWELWETLGEFYGSAFYSQYGDRPTWAWYGSLRDLSTADYGVGIESLKKRNSPFPPNPGEFFALCRPESAAQQRNRLGTARIGLPAPHVNPGREYLDLLRGLLE